MHLVNRQSRHQTVKSGTNLRAYLALIEAAHPGRQTEFVLLGSGPLSPEIDDRHGDESNQHDTADNDSNNDTDLLPFTAQRINTIIA